MTQPPLIVLGCGFLGTQVAKRAIGRGQTTLGTARSAARVEALHALGIETMIAPTIGADWFRTALTPGADLLVTYAPDQVTDALLAPIAASHDARIVYISSTAVYGAVRGRVDHHTPTGPDEPRGQRRLEAENLWAQANAIVLRAPAIYGPGRGLHLRIARGEHQLPDSGDNYISRIHVDDLARVCLAAFDRGTPGTRYVVGDLKPCPQREITGWLCTRMNKPMAAATPIAEVSPTLRNDRQVDPTWALEQLGITLGFPTYIEGYESCLRQDGLLAR
jgi:nucleoside-diphosphate-sugar epimerase